MPANLLIDDDPATRRVCRLLAKRMRSALRSSEETLPLPSDDETVLERRCANPNEFRKAVLIDCDGVSRVADDVLDPWQREDYAALDPAWMRIAGRFSGDCKARGYLERPRGHSKTTDIALMSSYVLLASERKIIGVAAAGSKEQAKLLRDGIDTLLRLNPWLSEHLTVNRFEVINKGTGSTLSILASDEKTTFGKTPDFVIVDELTHWKKKKLWATLFSSVAKRNKCVLVVISNAGDDMGWGWHWQVREACRTNPAWYFHKLDGPQASWLNKANLDEQRHILEPPEYKRVWLNQWQTGSGEGLSPEDITAACTLSGPWLDNRPPAYDCLGALDIGIKHDHAAFVVLGLDVENNRVRLVQAIRWDPRSYPNRRVPLKDVERTVASEAKRLNLLGVAYDPHQCERIAEELAEQGVEMYANHFTPKSLTKMAKLMLDYFTNRRIDLYPEPSLITDLHGLNFVKRGMASTTSANRDDAGHCGMGIALAIGLPWPDGTLKTGA